jgi:transcriptional regulator with XRE-family HTH domain
LTPLTLSHDTWHMATPRLTALIDQYKDAHGVSDSEIARRIGFSRENLRLWRAGLRDLPEQGNLRAVARTIGRPYREVLSAALFDSGYLTETDSATPRPYDEVLRDAVSALTEAARLTNQPVRHTSSGRWEPDPDPRAALPIDWAEFVTRALAGAAANVGSTAKILSGRPGSWEADRVRETLESTVGADDEHLLEHRTEPVTVELWVDDILLDLNADPYAEAFYKLDQRELDVPEPDDVPDEPPPPGMEWVLDRDEHGLAAWINDPAKVAAYQKYVAETPPQPRSPGEQAQEDALNRLAGLRESLDQLRRAELQSYADSLSAAITARLGQLNLDVPIQVTVRVAPNDADLRYGTTPLPGDSYSRVDEAVASAIAQTPGPAMLSGTPLERAERLPPDGRQPA